MTTNPVILREQSDRRIFFLPITRAVAVVAALRSFAALRMTVKENAQDDRKRKCLR